jgi:hypothetical protein
LDNLIITLRNHHSGEQWPIYVDIFDNSLAEKWAKALTDLVVNNYHLEKNYCFMGFPDCERSGRYILDQINQSISAINRADLGYCINDWFEFDQCITDEPDGDRAVGRNIVHERFNRLHRYFEDLQGVSGAITDYYRRSDPATRWHIRQLNLLCHEFECWALSYRKQIEAPEWVRPSMLMCWLQAPRFSLEPEDFKLFGIETMNRPTGGIFVGVNKAIGKHHWEVFNDEGRDSRVHELTTTTLRSQTEAAGDFDIEWGQNPGGYHWHQLRLSEFRQWLVDNHFDPDDPALTIGHPQVAQVDLMKSFHTTDIQQIWTILNHHLDVYKLSINGHDVAYDYHWSDVDYPQQQIAVIQRIEKC